MRKSWFAVLVGCSVLLPNSAQATTSGTCFWITGLAPGDSLNLRQRPSASAPIIGRFDSQSAPVIAKVGACGRWCNVSVHTGDGSFKGWMYSKYLERHECP